MNYVFQPNNLCGNRGYNMFFKWKEFMKSSYPDGPGWTVVSSSDATSYSLTSDILTEESDLNNIGAWFVIESPINKQLLIYKTGNTSYFMVLYSRDGYFTGGDESNRPTAIDEEIIWANSGGTSGAIIGHDADSSNYISTCHFGANTEDGYGFYMVGYGTRNSRSERIGGIILEELDPIIDGYDNDLSVFYVGGYGNANTYPFSIDYLKIETNDTSNFNETRFLTYLKSGPNSETFTSIIPFAYSTYDTLSGDIPYYPEIIPNGLYKNQVTNNTYCNSIYYGRRFRNGMNTASGIKGIGKTIFYSGIRYPYGTKVTINNINTSNTTYFSIGDLLLPCDPGSIIKIS